MCGKLFRPHRFLSHGKDSVIAEAHWKLQDTCSRSCSKKCKNPMGSLASRAKMSATLRRIGHKPIKRGGNGRLLPLPQLALLHALGAGWEAELAIPTGVPRGSSNLPTCYKVDIGNLEKRIAIEIDGGSHYTLEARERMQRRKLGSAN